MGSTISQFINPQKKPRKKNLISKPKIQRPSKTTNFNNKLKQNLTKYLFNFFKYKELYELGKINVYFQNNIIDYIHENNRWPEKLKEIQKFYDLEINKNEIDDSLLSAKINHRKYKYTVEDKVNYLQFKENCIEFKAIARYNDWAHKDNNSYWREENIEGSYTGEKVFYLVTVCWINVNLYFYHIKAGNYQLYINEHFDDSRIKGELKICVKIGNKEIYKNDNFPNDEIYNANNSSSNHRNKKLKEDFICNINENDFDVKEKIDEEKFVVEVSFMHRELYWKGGWYIDGGCLRKMDEEDI